VAARGRRSAPARATWLRRRGAAPRAAARGAANVAAPGAEQLATSARCIAIVEVFASVSEVDEVQRRAVEAVMGAGERRSSRDQKR
jgi:hypothetical protein